PVGPDHPAGAGQHALDGRQVLVPPAHAVLDQLEVAAQQPAQRSLHARPMQGTGHGWTHTEPRLVMARWRRLARRLGQARATPLQAARRALPRPRDHQDPMASTTFDLTKRRGRLSAYLHYLWYDHAYLRLGWTNAHWISEELVRANQPWPFQV